MRSTNQHHVVVGSESCVAVTIRDGAENFNLNKAKDMFNEINIPEEHEIENEIKRVQRTEHSR